MRVGLDTNVLAYAEGVGDEARRKSAEDLIATLAGLDVCVPVQVLAELHRVIRTKGGRPPIRRR